MITPIAGLLSRIRLSGVLICLLLLTVSMGTQAQALSTDLPSTPDESGVLGEPQLIEADVGAESVLRSITLFYRFDGEEDYRTLPMQTSNTPGVYAATVPTRGISANRLDFYIAAEDENGDTLAKGSYDNPLTRQLEPPPGTVTTTASAQDAPKSSGLLSGDRRKYLYIGLGILAVGALAASSGGSGSSSAPCGADGCPLTITLPTP